MTILPNDFKIFDESFIEYKSIKKDEFDQCPICSKPKPTQNKFCSLSCSGKNKRKVDWDNIDLLELLKTNSQEQVADMFNVSGNSVRKRLKKISKMHI